MRDQLVVGVGGYKGAPKKGKVEIAYGTVPEYENQGIATEVCRLLTKMAIEEDPKVRVTARTVMEENASTRVLKKNGFKLNGVVNDPEDGLVWEWEM